MDYLAFFFFLMGRMGAVFSSGFLHVFLRRLFKVVYYFSIGASPHPWALH